MYTEKLDVSELPTDLQILVPEDVEYIYVDFEYDPAEEGNRSGHPDTWTPDLGETFVLYSIYIDERCDVNSLADMFIPTAGLSFHTLNKIHDMCIQQLMERYSEY